MSADDSELMAVFFPVLAAVLIVAVVSAVALYLWGRTPPYEPLSFCQAAGAESILDVARDFDGKIIYVKCGFDDSTFKWLEYPRGSVYG
jgi:hypothetical protein